MIEFIFSALLVPLLPALADPAVSHDLALKELQARLNQAQLAQPTAVATELQPSEPQPNAKLALPAISGRLFDWSKASAGTTGQPSMHTGWCRWASVEWYSCRWTSKQALRRWSWVCCLVMIQGDFNEKMDFQATVRRSAMHAVNQRCACLDDCGCNA